MRNPEDARGFDDDELDAEILPHEPAPESPDELEAGADELLEDGVTDGLDDGDAVCVVCGGASFDAGGSCLTCGYDGGELLGVAEGDDELEALFGPGDYPDDPAGA